MWSHSLKNCIMVCFCCLVIVFLIWIASLIFIMDLKPMALFCRRTKGGQHWVFWNGLSQQSICSCEWWQSSQMCRELDHGLWWFAKKSCVGVYIQSECDLSSLSKRFSDSSSQNPDPYIFVPQQCKESFYTGHAKQSSWVMRSISWFNE